MIEIECPNCKKTHRVPKDRIPSGEARVRCSRCKHVFVTRPNSDRFDASEPGNITLEKAETNTPSAAEMQKGQTTQEEGMSLQEAFQILGLDSDASLDQINESYVMVCGVCLRFFDDSHDKNRAAGRLHEINQAYEIVLSHSQSIKPQEEEQSPEANQVYDDMPKYTTTNTSSLFERILQNQTDEAKSTESKIDSKANTQGLLFLTYSVFCGHLSTFLPTIIKSSFLLFIVTGFVSMLTKMIPQLTQITYRYQSHSWIIMGMLYCLFSLLVFIVVAPVALVAFEYSINNDIVRIRYVDMLRDERCFRIFKCYMFIASLLLIGGMLIITPYIILIYFYLESFAVMMFALFVDVVVLVLLGLFVCSRCLAFPYAAIYNQRSIINVFTNINVLPAKNVLDIWLVGLPLVVICIAFKFIQRHFESMGVLLFIDYLINLNYAVMVCVIMLAISFLYVRKRNNHETLTAMKT